MVIRQKGETFLLNYEIKVLFLGIAAFILALAAGFLFNGLLYGSLSQSRGASAFWILAAAALLLLVAMLAVSSLVIRQKVVYLFFGAAALALILPVATRANGWQWLAAGVLFLWMVWARRRIRSDLANFVKPKTGRILSRGVKKILSGLVIFISVFYFFSPQIRQTENLFVSRRLFEAVIVPVEKLVRGFAPEFRKDMTVDEAILKIAGKATLDEALKKEPRLKEMPAMEIENLRRQFFEQFKSEVPKQRQEFSARLGIALKGDEKIADVFYDFALAKLRELPGSARMSVGFFLALSLYFILKIAALPFAWLALALAVGLFWILAAADFFSVKKETIEKVVMEI